MTTLAGTPNAMVGDQTAAQGRVVGRARTQHAAHVAFAETFFIRRALHGVGVGEPLRRCRAHAGNDRGQVPSALQRITSHQCRNVSLTPSMTPPSCPTSRFGDAGAEHGELDGFGYGVEADGDRHQANAVPQKQLTESVALNAGDRIQADGGEHQADAAGDDDL